VSGLCHYEELGDDGQEVQDEVYDSDDDNDDGIDNSDDQQKQKVTVYRMILNYRRGFRL
jgi:hypothetical protein